MPRSRFAVILVVVVALLIAAALFFGFRVRVFMAGGRFVIGLLAIAILAWWAIAWLRGRDAKRR